MAFLISLVQTVVIAAFIAAVAYGGIILGKNLKVRKNAKLAQEALETASTDEAE